MRDIMKGFNDGTVAFATVHLASAKIPKHEILIYCMDTVKLSSYNS
jgi:hypothetical protein